MLDQLGYRRSGTSWASPHGRQLLFVGDLIDRGSRQMEVVDTVRSLVDAGRAQAIMGNHELNAIAFYHGHRPDTPKNRNQHAAFLAQVGEGSARHAELADWFMTLPLWLDLPELRVVHACWHPAAVASLSAILKDARLDAELLERAATGNSNTILADGSRPDENPVFMAVETLLKGIELDLPEGVSFLDKDGHERTSARLGWWHQPPATYADVCFVPGAAKQQPVMRQPLPQGVLPGYDNAKPLFLGHYWMKGTPELLAPKIACVDYSAGKGGPLVAYCWRGEDILSDNGFRATEPMSA